MQKPLLSGIQAGRDGVAAWAEHVDFILKTFGDTEHPVIAKIAIPDISTQNALLEKVYGKDMASAALRFRYMDVTSGNLPAKRISSLVTDAPEKVIYEGRADAEGIRFRFFRYSDDKGAEAEIARRVLVSLGVPEKDILVETKSVNTTQNARFSAEILEEKGFHQPILVTSAFHMKRAVLNFETVGVPVVPYPTDYMVSHHPVFHYTKLRPQTEALLDNVTVLQETLRTLVTKYTGR